MIINFIKNKSILFLLIFFIISCKDVIKKNVKIENINVSNLQIEKLEILDTKIDANFSSDTIDYYSNDAISVNLYKKNIPRIKINNFGTTYKSSTPINIVFDNNNYYSLNFKSEILVFEKLNGKLKDKIILKKK